jgi:hypothetical protein
MYNAFALRCLQIESGAELKNISEVGENKLKYFLIYINFC